MLSVISKHCPRQIESRDNRFCIIYPIGGGGGANKKSNLKHIYVGSVQRIYWQRLQMFTFYLKVNDCCAVDFSVVYIF